MIISFNNTITERDMDLLFAEAIATDTGFCSLVIDKTDLGGKSFDVVSVDISKSTDLGESDITAIIDIEGKYYGFLIEDKIDAPDMPDQHGRYIKRGIKGKEKGEYDDFRVFIFCPKKYYENNDEAKKYEHLLTYEEAKALFDNKDDSLSEIRSQQLEQALFKAKKPPIVNVNEQANAFLRAYIEYQKEHYPSLDLSTREDRNGWWTDYRTRLGRVWINHKIQEGYVDLNFPQTADKRHAVDDIAKWARHHGLTGATVVNTKSGNMIRIEVPKLSIKNGFDASDNHDLDACFDAIQEMTDFANIIELASSIT